MEPDNRLLRAALRYAELGYKVFPCREGGSTPLTTHGFQDASADAKQIEQWWHYHPAANIGLAAAGLLVVDIDAASEGEVNPWLQDEPDKLADLASVPTSRTPRGGLHYVFRRPPAKGWRCTQGELAPHVDTRTDGGYIVVPPSLRVQGAYRWVDGLELDCSIAELREPPEWLVAMLDAVASTRATGPATAATARTLGEPGNAIPAGQRNSTLARLAGAMRRNGMTQAEIAAAILVANTERCVPPLDVSEVQRIAASVAKYEPDPVAVAQAENHWEQMYAEAPANDEVAANPDPGPIPDHLLCVPGFVDEVMAYTLATAPYPERTLAFCGALALQALLAGRKVRDELDNRTNLYVLGLANSGAGKDHPRKVNQRILMHVGMSDTIGDMFASGEGIEDRMFIRPSMLFQTDEIDGLMTKINLGRDARHEGIMSVLLKMYTSASALYPMRVKAGMEPGIIDQPCLCIFGTAIPKHYYEALSLKMLTNGFFARMLILETGKRGKGQDAPMREPPASVLETAQWWSDFSPGERRANLADWHPIPKVIECSSEAADLLRAFRERAEVEYGLAEDKIDQAGMAIWARANEKARRLALIYACSANHAEPQITADAVRWACEFVDHQTRRMLFMTTESVAENEFDARCKKLVDTLRKWREKHGDAWMPFWQINRKHPWSEREHEEVRTTLLNQRLVEYQEKKTGGAPQRLYRLA